MENLFKDCERNMKISLDHLRQEISKLRTGRANGAILEGIKIDYYGNPTPLNQVATLGVPDSQTVTVQPYDVSILKDIEKAISASDLGLPPNNDGKIIRLNIPPLTGERRQQLVKIVKKYAEESKVAIRNVRRDFNDKLKTMGKNHEVSEDDGKKGLEKLQKITDEHIKEAAKLSETKEKEILNV